MIHSANELLKLARHSHRPALGAPDNNEMESAVEDGKKRHVPSIIRKYGSRLPDIIHQRLRQTACIERPFRITAGGVTYPGDKDDRSEIIWGIATAFRDAGADCEETAAVIMATPFWRDRIKDGKHESMARLLTKVYAGRVEPNKRNRETARSLSEDAGDWASLQLPRREWFLDDWIPMRKVTGVYGDGGVGKTTTMLQAACCSALGRPFLGMPVKKGRTYALLCEDERNDAHLELHAICSHYRVSLADLNGRIRVAPRWGLDNVLMTFENNQSEATRVFDDILQDIISYGPWTLVILDTASDIFGGNENDRGQVRKFLGECCGRIARETGAAVVVCAHPSLSGMTSRTGTAGSTAWNAGFKSRIYMRRDLDKHGNEADPDVRILELMKANFAARGSCLQLRWRNGGFVVEGDRARAATSADLEKRVMDEVAKGWDKVNPYSQHHQARDRWLVRWITENCRKSQDFASRVIKDLLDRELIVELVYDRGNHGRGLCTAQQAAIHRARSNGETTKLKLLTR